MCATSDEVAGQESQQVKATKSKRRYPRIDLPKGMPVAWSGGGKRDCTRISSLSLGGLFIATSEPPPPGTILHLGFDVPGGKVHARATVRAVWPGHGMGIEFMSMTTEDRARLGLLLKRLTSWAENK